MGSSSAGPSPSKNRRIDLGNGAFGYENADGSTYYNDGRGYETYQNPYPARCWERDPDSEMDNNEQMQFGRDEDQMAVAVNIGYHAGGFMPHEQTYANSRHGYDGNDSDPDAMPPPYSEHDPKPPKSLPHMQTARRGTPKQAAKRGSYAHLGGGPALSTYRPNIPHGPMPSTARVSAPQSPASRGGRAPTPKPSSSRTPTPRRQPSPTKPSSALFTPKPTSEKKPARKKCSQCHVPGHDARHCPLNRFGLGKSPGASQGLSQQGFREMSETTTATTKTTTKHSKSSSVMDGRVSKPKATPKKKGTGKK